MQRKTARFTMFLLTALIFTSLFIPQLTSAADFEGTVKLEGEETFSLTASEMQLFDFENIAPGDVRTGTLHIENTTDRKMECRILSIMSYSEDKRLFDAMRLRITDRNGTTLYDGPYGCNSSEPLTAISLKPKKVRTLSLEVSFPAVSGNEYQAAEMDSIWTFEARVFDKSAPSDNGNKDDGNKDDDNKGDNEGNGNGDGGSNSSGDSNGNHSEGQNKGNGNSSGDSEQGSGTGSGAAKGNGKDTSGVKTGLDLTLSNSGLIIGMILVGLCFLAAIVTSIRIYAAKHKRKDDTDK